MRTKLLFIVYLFLCSFTFSSAQQAVFLNTGAMNVSGSMYVQGSIEMRDPLPNSGDVAVVVSHNGTTYLEGDFIHNATGNVFDIMNENWGDTSIPRGITPSSGAIHFVGDNVGGNRQITTNDALFDRVLNYIAFPNLVIATNDTIRVANRLGFDARTILRDNTNHHGLLYLTSDHDASDGIVFTTSLRVTGDNGHFTVAPDAILIEKFINPFRDLHDAVEHKHQEATALFPFASPFQSMRAGVFAGNWVRRPLIDAGRNSFLFPYANEAPPGSNVIAVNQFLRLAYDEMEPTVAYLIRLQAPEGRYDGLDITHDDKTPSGKPHDRPLFHFGESQPFMNMTPRSVGSLFAGRHLLENRSVVQGLPYTQNWVVGNSFTSGLNTRAIVEYLNSLGMPNFIQNIFIFPHGSTHYEIYSMADPDIPDIQAMSVFMIAVDRNQGASATPVVINHRFQEHIGGVTPDHPGHHPLEVRTRSAQAQSSVLNFVLTPENNPFIFSRSSVRFSASAGADVNADRYDISALINPSNGLFHLYGTNESRTRLQQNVLPYDAPLAMLSVNPAGDAMRVVLTVEGAENFASEVVELWDRRNNRFLQDLRANNSHSFILSPGDNPDRFEVRFTHGPTDVDNTVVADWQAYTFGGELIIFGLGDSLLNSLARIHGASGALHIQEPIRSVPEHRINISSLPAGVYMLSIEGRTVKFIR